MMGTPRVCVTSGTEPPEPGSYGVDGATLQGLGGAGGQQCGQRPNLHPRPSAGPWPSPDRPSHTPACLPQPVRLDASAYVRAVLPIGLLLPLCLLQAFAYRLRRVIAAFYFPKVHPPKLTGLHPAPPTQAAGRTVATTDLLSLAPAREEADPVPLQ